MAEKKQSFKKWCQELGDHDREMTLAEVQAIYTGIVVDNQVVLDKRLQQLTGQLDRIEQAIAGQMGASYPKGNADPREQFARAREAIKALQAQRDIAIEEAVLP